MQEKNTAEVEAILESMKPSQLKEFYKNNNGQMADEKKAFYYYVKDVTEAKNILLKDVYSFAGVSESYGEKIVRMEKHTTNRDLIIRLCIAGRFSLVETNKALKLYGMNSLYSKDARDASIIVAINNRIYNLADVDDILLSNGFLKLSV